MKQRKQREKDAQELEIDRFHWAKRLRQNAGTAPILALRGNEKGTEKFCPFGIWWWIVFPALISIDAKGCSVVIEGE